MLNGHDATVISEKSIVPPAVENIHQTQNITMDRPKGKLGGAQRVNRNGDNKKVILEYNIYLNY
jgi:hypothetical protein